MVALALDAVNGKRRKTPHVLHVLLLRRSARAHETGTCHRLGLHKYEWYNKVEN